MELEDGFMPEDHGFKWLVARYKVVDFDHYYSELKLKQLMTQDVRKLYTVDYSAGWIAAILHQLILSGAIIQVELYYEWRRIRVMNFVPENLSMIWHEDKSRVLGMTRHEENERRYGPSAETYTFTRNASGIDCLIELKAFDSSSKLPPPMHEPQSDSTSPPRKSSNSGFDDSQIEAAIIESIKSLSLESERLDLGYKSFPITDNTMTLCRLCGVGEVKSIAIPCEHTLFCHECLKEYKKSGLNGRCIVCDREVDDFDIWD